MLSCFQSASYNYLVENVRATINNNINASHHSSRSIVLNPHE